jgi:hypothetical protein
MTDALTQPLHPLVIQHNALVNARFDLTTTEVRLFLAMLSRVQRTDTTFAKCEVGVREILDQASSQNYGHVRKVLEKFASRLITIETLTPGGRRPRQRKYSVIPLLARADYLEGEGLLVLRFNDELHDYLLELHDNFTKAQLTELLKLKSAPSYRIYWLLREYASFGKRTIEVGELKAILGLSEGYDSRFNNFRRRVLERAREELATTDLPFTYSTLSKGRLVTHIEFHFQPGAGLPPALPAPAPSEWEAAVLAAGVAASSLPAIRAQVAAGAYDLGYVRFVLDTVQAQVAAGKIKRPAGAVFKALTAGYLLADYQKRPQERPISKTGTALAKKRQKLASALEDAKNSLSFVETAAVYTPDTRPAALAAVQATIERLETQLAALGS